MLKVLIESFQLMNNIRNVNLHFAGTKTTGCVLVLFKIHIFLIASVDIECFFSVKKYFCPSNVILVAISDSFVQQNEKYFNLFLKENLIMNYKQNKIREIADGERKSGKVRKLDQTIYIETKK